MSGESSVQPMRGLLVRVAVDSGKDGGKWNGPVERATRDFAYVSIPENNARAGMEKPYRLVTPALGKFGWSLPPHLAPCNMHLDPDFSHLTYGDQGSRADQIRRKVGPGDLIVFYAGLRDTLFAPRLLYGIIGLYVIDAVLSAAAIPSARWDENAHTRYRWNPKPDDVVVRARPGVSGRLARCIEIGSYRPACHNLNGRPCYRVESGTLAQWGGLDVRDGFLQRSAYLPVFSDAARFYRWFLSHGIPLIATNN